MDCVVGWQFLLAPWVLSTWFGDWLASQSPNPSWQHRVSLKHMHTIVMLCHFLSLIGMLCHVGGWDMVADTLSAPHTTSSNLTKHMILLTHLVLGLMDRQFLRVLILQTKMLLMGVATCWVLFCQLDVWKNGQRKAWEVWTTKLPN